MKQPDSLDVILKIFQYHWGGHGDGSLEFVQNNIKDNLTLKNIASSRKLCDIAPLIYKVIKDDNHLKHITPRPLFETVKSIYYSQMRRCLMQYNQLSSVLKELNHIGCPIILLKGFALSEAVYNDLAVRPMSDIDLLVQKKYFSQAEGIISRLGFKKIINPKFSGPIAEHAFHTQFFKTVNDQHIMLELHHDLAKETHPFNTTECWSRARPYTFGQNNALVMEPNDLLVYLSLHIARHNFKRLLWLCDIAQVITVYKDTLHWKTLVKISHDSKSNIALFYSISLTSNYFHIEIPSDWNLKDLSVSIFSRYWLDKLLINHITDEIRSGNEDNLMTLATRLMIEPGIMSKINVANDYIRLLVFRNSDDLKKRYNIKNNIMLNVTRIIFPLIVLFRAIAEVIKRPKK